MQQFILNKLIEKFPTKTLEELKETIARIEDIGTALYNIEYSRKEIEKQYQNNIKEVENNVRRIQHMCKHELTEYYPDASGNNDSSTECLICGKEL